MVGNTHDGVTHTCDKKRQTAATVNTHHAALDALYTTLDSTKRILAAISRTQPLTNMANEKKINAPSTVTLIHIVDAYTS